MIFDPLLQEIRGDHAIEASAGTGKTYSITLLWLRLILEQHLRVDQILVTTFTTAATAELKSRLLDTLHSALASARGEGKNGPVADIVARTERKGHPSLERDLQNALSCFDLAPIHTMHGFCQSLLNRYMLELSCDPGLELSDHAEHILDELTDDELMRQAGTGLLSLREGRRMAATLARELAIPDENLLLPPIDDSLLEEKRWDEARSVLLDIASNPESCLRRWKVPERSIPKAAQMIRDHWQGLPEAEDFAATVRAKIDPPILSACDGIRAILGARKAAIRRAFCLAIREQYPLRKRQAGVRTFDDLLLTVHQALQQQGDHGALALAVRERYRAAVIDECQDSDSVQIAIFRALFQGNAESFLVIGDPKQSIYRFRGADLASYQDLVARTKKAPPMRVNYRSDQALVSAINTLYAKRPTFRAPTEGMEIEYIQVEARAKEPRLFDEQRTEPLLLLWSECEDRQTAKRDLARMVAVEFRRLLHQRVRIEDREKDAVRPLIASDLAVLAGIHSELSLMHEALAEQGLYGRQAGKGLGSIWQTDEATDILAWLAALRAFEERSDPLSALLAFAATPLGGLLPQGLESLRNDPLQQVAVAGQIQEELLLLRRQGPLPPLQLRWQGPMETHLRYLEGERRITNWRHLGTLLQYEWTSGRRQAGDLALWLSRRRAGGGEKSDIRDEEELLRLETDLPAVQLATIHGSKGLEYPIVACPFLWHVKSRQIRLQRPVAVVRKSWGTLVDAGSGRFEAHRDEDLQQEDDEEQRKLYVALTRARHRLYVGLAPVGNEKSDHKNSARNSAWAQLLRLDQESTSWEVPIPRCEPVPVSAAPPPLRVDELDTDTAILRQPPIVDLGRLRYMRIGSYSGLTSGEDVPARDHDVEEKPQPADPGILKDLGLSGARLGDRMHRLLEEILGNRRALTEVVADREEVWSRALEIILDTPLDFLPGAPTLPTLRSMAEMHFLIPAEGLDPRGLSRALLEDARIRSTADRRTWAEGLANWHFGRLHGFLQGYMDLIFVYRDRWYIIDYKTNALPSYRKEMLETAMLEHHYLLQARLYALALQRHLRATLPGYDPSVHLGGCAYLFLRGLPQNGIWYEPVQPEAVMAMDSYLKGSDDDPER